MRDEIEDGAVMEEHWDWISADKVPDTESHQKGEVWDVCYDVVHILVPYFCCVCACGSHCASMCMLLMLRMCALS